MIDLKLLDPIVLAITVSSNFPKKPIYLASYIPLPIYAFRILILFQR